MRVRIPNDLLFEVTKGEGQELKTFRGLSSEERNDILTETHQRVFMNELLTTACNWERTKNAVRGDKRSAKAGNKAIVVNNADNIDNEVLENVVSMATKSKKTETVEELVSVNHVIKTDGKFSNVPKKEMQEKKVKVARATAKVSFSFDSKKSVLSVNVVEIVANDAATEAHWRKDLEKAIERAGETVEIFYNVARFTKALFDTLHVHRMCNITGAEAINMMRIYKNARIAYPVFAKLDRRVQVDILDRGYRRARSISAGSRDIHAFAKGTFEAMCEVKGVIDVVYKHDFITNKMMTFTKIAEFRRDRVNPDRHTQIWEKNSLVFVDYVYGKCNFRTSLLAFDLWDLLARGVKNSEASIEIA